MERNRMDRSKIKVLVNRYHKDYGLSRDVIEAALHTDVYHLVPSDYENVQRALVEGKSIPPGSDVGKAILGLAEKLTGKPKATPPPKTSGLSNLFGFLRR
jgi:Flp pilus assembly CpaE family ATPase